MAKGSLLMGTQRGKLGESVLYRAYGSQIMRAKAASVKNPRSAAQMLQRLVLASSSKTAAVLRPILDHSFQSVQYGAESMRYARKLIIKTLREQAVMAFNNEGGVQSEVGLLPLTAQGASIAAFPVSQGSIIPFRTFMQQQGSVDNPVGRVAEEGLNFDANVTLAEWLNSAAATKDMQITFVFLLPLQVGASENGSPFYAGSLQLARVNFLADADTTAKVFTLADEASATYKFNPALIDASRSTNVDKLLVEVDTGGFTFQTEATISANSNSVAAGTIIKSKYDGTKWLRSTQYLSVGYPTAAGQIATLQGLWGYNIFDEVLDSVYAEGNITEDRYLNKEKN